MIGYAVEVTAAAARANIPERIRTKLVAGGRGQVHGPAQDGAAAPGWRHAAASLDEVDDGWLRTARAPSAGSTVHAPEREGRQVALAAVFEAEFGQRTATTVLPSAPGRG